jgi:hypothetical protein
MVNGSGMMATASPRRRAGAGTQAGRQTEGRIRGYSEWCRRRFIQNGMVANHTTVPASARTW